MEANLLRSVSLKHLRLVSVLGAELSLSRCAERMNTTQPAISRLLTQLEDHVGARLFERTTKRVRLTAAGMTLMQHANRILIELDLASENLAGLQGALSGEVRIGMLPTFSAMVLGGVLRGAKSSMPDVMFACQTMELEPLHDALINGQIDVMLSHVEFSLNLNSLHVVELYQEHSTLVCSPAHSLLRRRKPVSLKELAQYPWILPPPDTPLRPKINKMLSLYRTQTLAGEADMQTNSHLIALAALARSPMIWGLPHQYAMHYKRLGQLGILNTPDIGVQGPMCCITRRDEVLKAPVSAFISALKEAGRSLIGAEDGGLQG